MILCLVEGNLHLAPGWSKPACKQPFHLYRNFIWIHCVDVNGLLW